MGWGLAMGEQAQQRAKLMEVDPAFPSARLPGPQVRYVGLSNETPWGLCKALALAGACICVT